ncbi:viral A-type inclusion protein [Campylobacter sp. JMF_04 NA10]|uniref:viral A-type inclusion protein n=1 Tax=Campylobacter sp. JMF_04 NA10 TaxID=2983824 RepID=UPI0022E99DEB|nr:viral A-type inclusion protein [Campylobacter sp. JMF_04 NA10]MDA3077302.1 viral A-type inclusion protein [Campylobacter sp. JMF_04 NA10]
MKIKKLLFLFFVCFSCGALLADGSFVLKKESNEVSSHETEKQIDENVIYVRNISGAGESLEIAKKDAIQNAMRFGVGELLVSKEELNNDELSQEIMNYSNAYVLDYQQISEVNDGGIYKVQADVKLEKNKVLGTLSKLNINALDLSSGVLKNYSEDMANKKENAEKLIIDEIVEPFKNGYAYDLEILDLQPIDRSDLMKSRSEKGRLFRLTYNALSDFNIPSKDLFVAKIKIKMNENFAKKTEKIISQFSEKLSYSEENMKHADFVIDNRLFAITDEYIRKELFKKQLENIRVYGLMFKLIDSENELWIKKCSPISSGSKRYSPYSIEKNQDRDRVANGWIEYAYKLKKIKKFTEEDKKNNVEYYFKGRNDSRWGGYVYMNIYEEPAMHWLLSEIPYLIDPIHESNGNEFLMLNTKELILHIIIQLDEQDIANTNKIEVDFLYTKKNECND